MTDHKTLEPFVFKDEKTVFKCKIFSVHEKMAVTKNEEHTLDVYTLTCSDWVNVVPVTSAGQIVLVEQHRFGTDNFVLEVPGGAVHRDEKDTTMAAIRELEEETGLTSKRVLSLPGFYPNPAMQNNRMSYFIAMDVHPVQKAPDHFDPFEEIKIHLVSVKEAMHMVRTGQIKHALSALALLLAEPYLNSKFNT